MSEVITLDPTEIMGSTRAELVISSGAIQVTEDGIDWGTAEIEAFLSDQQRGSTPIDYRVPNRTVTMGLIVQEDGPTSFAEARAALQAKVSRFQQEGGALKRQTPAGTLYMDVVNASLTLPGSWYQALRDFEPEATLTLECLPDFYGDEVALLEHNGVGIARWNETDISGDFPARVRMVVTETSGQNMKGLLWSVRSLNYSADATAAPSYACEDLTAISPATVSGGAVVADPVTSVWTPYLSTEIVGEGNMTHIGNYRMFVRVLSTNTAAPAKLRLVWGVGDVTNPLINAEWTFPAPGSWYLADLGNVRVKSNPLGEHAWMGQIQAMCDGDDESVTFGEMLLVNTDDGMGIATASSSAAAGFDEVLLQDSFDQAAGAATGKTLPVGGSWTGFGDATDFTINDTWHLLQRSATDDADLWGGRGIYGSAGSNSGQIDAQVDLFFTQGPGDAPGGSELRFSQGLVLRWVDANNWVIAALQTGLYWVTYGQPVIAKKVAGTVTTIVAGAYSQFFGQVMYPYTLRAGIDTVGNCYINVSPFGTYQPDNTWSGQDDDLAVGGDLEEGYAGIWDANNSSTAGDRYFNNYQVAVNPPDAALYANEVTQITTAGAWRLDGDTDHGYGRVANYRGDLPRLPTTTADGRTTEVMIRPSTGDFDQLPDQDESATFTARLYYRPSWLIAPG